MELDMFHSGCHPCEVMLLTISALQMRHRGLKILASLAEMELKPRHEQEWLPEGLWQCCGCRFYSRSYRVASDRSVASGLPCK